MVQAYSLDLRERVIGFVVGGGSARGAARHFGIGDATAIRWIREWRRTGSYEPAPFGKPHGSKLDAYEEFLLGLIEDEPDITLEEIRGRLADQHGVSAGIGTLWRFFDARGINYKKKTGHACEQDREDVHAARLAWFEGQPDLDPERLIFIPSRRCKHRLPGSG